MFFWRLENSKYNSGRCFIIYSLFLNISQQQKGNTKTSRPELFPVFYSLCNILFCFDLHRIAYTSYSPPPDVVSIYPHKSHDESNSSAQYHRNFYILCRAVVLSWNPRYPLTLNWPHKPIFGKSGWTSSMMFSTDNWRNKPPCVHYFSELNQCGCMYIDYIYYEN